LLNSLCSQVSKLQGFNVARAIPFKLVVFEPGNQETLKLF